MRLGYSLLLGEYVEATDIDYEACRKFQVVCPICKEALFKAGSAETKRQWLSHYAATQDSECELRVGRMTSQQVMAHNLVQRGQSLELFNSVFRHELLHKLYPHDAALRDKVAWHTRWMARRPTYRALVRHIRSRFKKSAKVRDAAWASVVYEYPHLEFVLKVQQSYARDYCEHLMTGPAIDNFTFAVSMGLRASYQDLERGGLLVFDGADVAKANEQALERMKHAANLLIMGSEKDLKRALPVLPDDEDVALAGDYTLADYGISGVMHMLVNFPYLKVLEQSVQTSPALEHMSAR